MIFTELETPQLALQYILDGKALKRTLWKNNDRSLSNFIFELMQAKTEFLAQQFRAVRTGRDSERNKHLRRIWQEWKHKLLYKDVLDLCLSPKLYNTEMPLGFQIRVGKQ